MTTPVARVPLAGDVADLIGESARHVENRSLLLDKFVFHKQWGLHEIKANDASRWSLLRIAEGGPKQIDKEARDRADEADRLHRKSKNPEKVERLRIEAGLARTLAGSDKFPDDLAALRARHTRRFLGLFREAYGDRASVTVARIEGRLAINLADGLIENAGICLDRLFGLPFIPGSAVKGVCRHAALEELAQAADAEREKLLRAIIAVFGCAKNDFEPAKPARKRDEQDKPPGCFFPYLDLMKPCDQKGAVAFLPAYPADESTKIVVDLTNVHYPAYYKSGNEQDQRNEKPQPNPFPAVERGAHFAFCLVLTRTDADSGLLGHARRWLESALTVHGLGAKTAAGYGWFSIQPEALEAMLAEERKEAEAVKEREEAAKAEAEAAAAEAARKAALSPEDVAKEDFLAMGDQEFATVARSLGDELEPRQRAFVALLANNKQKREVWKRWNRRKPDLAKAVAEVAANLNLSLP